MNSLIFREASVKDAGRLLEIYAPYVKETAITYEYDVPSRMEFRNRIKKISRAYPYIVACLDGKIVGYAYANVFHERKAYEHSAELSIYIDSEYHKLGIGTKLYTELEKRLKEKGFKALYACIAATSRDKDLYLTDGSISFHEAAGYKTVGRFTDCAVKFGLWYDMVYMEKHI